MRLGDFDELKEEINREVRENRVGVFVAKRIFDIIDNAPTVENNISETYGVAYEQGFRHGKEKYERPQGEWILQYRAGGDEFYTCSLCERAIEVDYPQTLKDFPFCHCGADMRGNKKETTFDDYLKEQLKDPEFRKEWENCVTKICRTVEQKENKND